MTTDVSFEIVAKFFRENFHPDHVTVSINRRSDTEGFRILLTENATRKQKEFLTGRTTTLNDLSDMAITAAKLFNYVWDNTPYEGAPV